MLAAGPLGLLLAAAAAALPVIGGLPTFAGKYIAYGKRFYHCDLDINSTWSMNIRATHFRPARPRELQRITGNITVGSEAAGLDDLYWGHVVLDTRSNNQWKENAFVFDFPNQCCSTLRTHIPDIFRIIFEGRSLHGECFVPSGSYHFRDQPVKWEFPYFPIIPYGEYRFRLKVGRNPEKQVRHCLTAEAVAIPKI